MCKKQQSDRRTVSAPDLLKTEGLSFTILTRNTSSRPQAAPDRQIGGHTPDQRPVQSPRVLGEAGVSTPAGLPPPKDITVTRGTEATGSQVQCPGCLVQGTAARLGHTWKTREATSDGEGDANGLKCKDGQFV